MKQDNRDGAERKDVATRRRAPEAPSAPTPAAARRESGSEPAGQKSLLPAITQPKGGGAIRGIGEKFSTNAATGTGSLSIPIATSPGRAGFDLSLQVSYDTGAGNGPFGVGWGISVPAITRKTDKGLPRYFDGDGGDTYVLSGAEDLVPVATPASVSTGQYEVQRYRPRVEGLFARIERWTDKVKGDVHWRVTTRDNVLNIYGATPEARIADPRAPVKAGEHPAVGRNARIFSWLLQETRDDRGNIARYTYKGEDGVGVTTRLSELSRFSLDDSGNVARDANGDPVFEATAQRYLARIQYGNRQPVARDAIAPAGDDDWLFEVVFDYGEYAAPATGDPHATTAPAPGPPGDWKVREDPFSSYRAGFEVRTYRLCRRVLMFHRFPVGTHGIDVSPCLVRSTDFAYDEGSVMTYLESATQAGYRWDASAQLYERATMPSLDLSYARVPDDLSGVTQYLDDASLEGIRGGVDGGMHRWVDLDGEGLPGVLSTYGDAWYFKRSNGGGRLGAPAELRSLPAPSNLNAGAQLTDLGGDGQLDLVQYAKPLAG